MVKQCSRATSRILVVESQGTATMELKAPGIPELISEFTVLLLNTPRYDEVNAGNMPHLTDLSGCRRFSTATANFYVALFVCFIFGIYKFC